MDDQYDLYNDDNSPPPASVSSFSQIGLCCWSFATIIAFWRFTRTSTQLLKSQYNISTSTLFKQKICCCCPSFLSPQTLKNSPSLLPLPPTSSSSSINVRWANFISENMENNGTIGTIGTGMRPTQGRSKSHLESFWESHRACSEVFSQRGWPICMTWWSTSRD